MLLILPTGHTNAKLRALPWVSLGIAFVCALVQAWSVLAQAPMEGLYQAAHEAQVSGLGADVAVWQLEEAYAALPATRLGMFSDEPSLARALTSAFVHDGWTHLFGNLVFLYVVGLTLEDRWGRLPFFLLFMVGAVAAAYSYVWWADSHGLLVGASGAIAALMGAFTIAFFAEEIELLVVWLFVGEGDAATIQLPVWALLPAWALFQALMAWLIPNAEVAYAAHVGGFAVGIVAGGAARAFGLSKRRDRELDRASVEFAEDEAFVEAVRLLGDNPTAAFDRLRAFYQRAPQHLEAAELLLVHDPGKLTAAELDRILPLAARSARHESVATWMARVGGSAPLGRSGWTALLACADAIPSPEFAVQICRRLMTEHPRDELTRRAMYAAGLAQARAERLDLATQTFNRLAADPAADHWTERARDWIAARTSP